MDKTQALIDLNDSDVNVRKNALSSLSFIKKDSDIEKALKEAFFKEKYNGIKKQILMLLSLNDTDEKECVFVDLNEELVKPSDDDEFLFKAEIAGIFYRSKEPLERKLNIKDVLFFKRDRQNAYDENAIMVVTKDGYVMGFIPKLENTIPAMLMDEGKTLYAVVEDIYIKRSAVVIAVKIFVSCR